MIKRTVEISTPGTHVGMREKQMVLYRDGQEIGCVPCEDVGILISDEHQMTFTQAALVSAVENGAAVIFCSRDHHPSGLLLPFAGNQLLTERLQLQIEMKKPLVKRLWRQIVQVKLRRQADRLPKDNRFRARIHQLSKDVKLDDEENCEAQAAKLYWPALFGPAFIRHREGPAPNNLLNYGYMTIRAAMARAICGAGLHPAIGLHHHNRSNPFCLADDLMEPFRPFVDARVIELWSGGSVELRKEEKKSLLGVLTDDVVIAGKRGPLMVALSKTVSSLVECLAGNRENLDLPQP